MTVRIGILQAVPILLATVVGPIGCAMAATEYQAKEYVQVYASIGRIKWLVPSEKGFYFAVPHFTQGPRLKCGFPGGGNCEISVYARVLTTDSEQRQKKYFSEMDSLLGEAVEPAVQVRSYGSRIPVFYATLTDKNPKRGYRYLTRGLHVKGTFVIKFEHLTNDSTGDELREVLRVVHSAEPLDAVAFLTWKLSDYKAICEERFPEFKRENNAAFSASIFANVDWIGMLQTADAFSTREQITAHFNKARQALAKEFSDGPAKEWEAFCRSYPQQVVEAQRAM